MHALLARPSKAQPNGGVARSTLAVVPGPSTTESIADAPLIPARDVRQRPEAVANPARRDPSIARTSARALRAYSEDEIQHLIRVYAEAFGIDPAIPLAIARCESQFHWNAANRSSSARGVFQYVAGTWAATPEGRRGTSPLDADANIRMAITHMITIGTSPWNASRACWDA